MDRHQETRCSFETYRQVVKSMNPGITRLAGEECSKCSLQLQHSSEEHAVQEQEPQHHTDGCRHCEQHKQHIADARAAKEQYRADAQ